MGQKPLGPATAFGRKVIAVIDDARREAGLSKAELIERSGMAPNTFHTRMRAERPFNTTEIEKLADALGLDPVLLLQRAAGGVSAQPLPENVTPIGGRRLSDVSAADEDDLLREPHAANTDDSAGEEEPETT